MARRSQVVFVLTSSGRDRYSAMTRVAVASLRHSNPGLHIVVACDADSGQAMQAARDPLMAEVDEWRAMPTPAGDAVWRNRFVKTSLRSLIDGPYLFLDSDVFVRDDLAPVFGDTNDVAAARNHSRASHPAQLWAGDINVLRTLGWAIREDVYFNGGVMFCNDTPGSHRFADDWHRRWLHCCAATGGRRDQPALNAAVAATRPTLTLLHDRFNAQVHRNPAVAHGAAIWHFYASDGEPGRYVFYDLVDEVQRTGAVDRQQIAALAQALSPWP